MPEADSQIRSLPAKAWQRAATIVRSNSGWTPLGARASPEVIAGMTNAQNSTVLNHREEKMSGARSGDGGDAIACAPSRGPSPRPSPPMGEREDSCAGGESGVQTTGVRPFLWRSRARTDAGERTVQRLETRMCLRPGTGALRTASAQRVRSAPAPRRGQCGGRRTLCNCGQCDTVYLRTRPTQRRMEQLYQSYADEGVIWRFPVATRKPPKASCAARRFCARSSSSSRRWQVAGYRVRLGAFLLNARDRGFEPLGLELTGKAVDYANHRLGLPVVSRQFLDASYPPASLRVVTMLHVLEHLPRPRPAIERSSRVSNRAGCLRNRAEHCVLPVRSGRGTSVLARSQLPLRALLAGNVAPGISSAAGFVIERLYTPGATTSLNDCARSRWPRTRRWPTEPLSTVLSPTSRRAAWAREIRFFARKPGPVPVPAPVVVPCPSGLRRVPVRNRRPRGLGGHPVVQPGCAHETLSRDAPAKHQRRLSLRSDLVDNASTDATGDFLNEAPRLYAWLRVIREPENAGLAPRATRARRRREASMWSFSTTTRSRNPAGSNMAFVVSNKNRGGDCRR